MRSSKHRSGLHGRRIRRWVEQMCFMDSTLSFLARYFQGSHPMHWAVARTYVSHDGLILLQR